MNEQPLRRIGFVADGGDAGGARTHILALLARMPEHNIECYFFSLGEGALSSSVKKLEKIHFTPYPLKSKADPRIFKAIQHWAKEHRLDIVHTHGLKANMYARLALYRSPMPIVTTYHSHPFFDYRNLLFGIAFTIIDQLSLHRSNRFIAVSYEISTQLEHRGISRDKITIIKNGVDISRSQFIAEKNLSEQIRSQWDIPSDAFLIGSLGRLVKVKGYREMLHLFKECLLKTDKELYLLIIGGGEEEPSLKKLAETLNIQKRVRWAGYQKDPWPLVQACDLMLFTPKSEALGIAILECMASKKAIVSKKVGGIQELLLDRYNGRIRSKRNELVKIVLELSCDLDQRKALAENGFQMALRFFTREQMVKKTVQLYRSIKKDRVCFQDLPVDNYHKVDLLPVLSKWLNSSTCHQIVTINLEMIARSQKDSLFKKAIKEAELVIPDGVSIIKLARWIDEFISEKVAGIELGEDLLKLAEANHKGVFFLGSSSENLQTLRTKLIERFPSLNIAGMHHGFFSDSEEKDIVALINQSNADLLFVGMGAGKQDCFIHRNKKELKAKIAMGIGGSLDIWSGRMHRAPAWAIKYNLEWLYRIIRQPKLRLYRFISTVPVLFFLRKRIRAEIFRILISGYYGYGNIGDETILQTLVRDLKSFSNTCNMQLTVLSSNPHMTTSLAEVNSSRRFNLISLVREIMRTNGLISGGGGLIQDITSIKSPWYYLGIIALAHILNKRVLVYANGIGPLHHPLNRFLARSILSKVQQITVRDEHSENLLQSWGIKHCQLTVDPIFSYQPIPIQDPYQQYNDYIAVSLGPSKETALKIKLFAHHLDLLSQKTGKYCLFTPFYGTYDSRFSAKIIKQMNEKSYLIDTFLLPEEMFSLLKRSAFGVGMRLHFLVFLSLLNKPILPIMYDPKVEAFCQQLALPFAWRKNISQQEMTQQMEFFIPYSRQAVSYQSSLKDLSFRNIINKENLREFICF